MSASTAGRPRLGVLGGTFDPVHNGHLVAAVSARHTLTLERVLLVVAHDPWQKQGQVLAPAEDRLAMVEAAVDGVDGLEASRLELDRPGPTYTADTLEELHRRHPDADLYLILGADAAADLGTWDRPEAIRAMATIVVVSRGGAEDTAGPGPSWPTTRVRIPDLAISSTDLRRRAAAGDPLEGLMPPGAIRCLRERGLYAQRR